MRWRRFEFHSVVVIPVSITTRICGSFLQISSCHDTYLGVGSGSHTVQTAAVMERFEPVVIQDKPDWVLVIGDVNSTIACALVYVKLG